jgi:hypothetical protein
MTPHEQMLEDHRQAKAARRERHKRNHGRTKPYCGNFY